MEGGRAANLSFDLRLGFTTGEIYSDTNAHKVALWLAKPTGGLEGSSDDAYASPARVSISPPSAAAAPLRRRRRSQHAGRRLIARLTAAIPIIRSFIWLQNC